MNDKIRKQSGVQKKRRKLVKGVATSGAIVTAAALPKQWLKPVVDTVILPAHALCTDGCDTTLSITAVDMSGCSSGPTFNPITLTGLVSDGCEGISILSIVASMPGSATYSGLAVGDVLNPGDVFSIVITNYPNGLVFGCQAPDDAAFITITYDCATVPGGAKEYEINVLAAILDNNNSPALVEAKQAAEVETPETQEKDVPEEVVLEDVAAEESETIIEDEPPVGDKEETSEQAPAVMVVEEITEIVVEPEPVVQ